MIRGWGGGAWKGLVAPLFVLTLCFDPPPLPGSIRLPKAAKAPLKIHPLARLPLAAIVKELGEGLGGGKKGRGGLRAPWGGLGASLRGGRIIEWSPIHLEDDGGIFGILGGPQVHLGAPWGELGASWGCVEAPKDLWGALWGHRVAPRPWGGLGGPWELLGDTQGWLWGYGYLRGGLFSPHCGAQHQHFSPLIPPPQRHRLP